MNIQVTVLDLADRLQELLMDADMDEDMPVYLNGSPLVLEDVELETVQDAETGDYIAAVVIG